MKNQNTVDLIKLNREDKKSTDICMILILELIVLAGMAGFVFKVTSFKITEIGLNMKVILNDVSDLIGEKYGIITPKYKLNSDFKMELLLAGIIVLIAIILYIAIKFESQPVFIIGIITTLVVQGTFGNNRSYLMASVLIFAYIICLNKKRFSSAFEKNNKSKVLIVLSMLIVSILCVPISNKTNADKLLKNLSENINHKADDFRYLKKNKIALKVKMSKPQSYYLKGFVAGEFSQNGWKETENKKLYKYSDLFFWLHKENFYGQKQLFNAKSESNSEIVTNKMTVNVIGASSKYIYTPYEYVSDNDDFIEKNKIGDEKLKSKGLCGTRKYEFNVADNIVTDYSDIIEKLNNKTFENQGKSTRQKTDVNNEINKNAAQKNDEYIPTDYLKNEKYYNEFVYKTYLDLTVNQKEILGTYLKKNNDNRDSYSYAKSEILNYLNKNIKYTKKSQEIKDYGNFLNEFMEVEKVGNDKDYATATVLMFRYFGIPARYVEGYLITKDDVKDAADNSTINISKDNFHCWAEYYQDGVGWIPFETIKKYMDLMGTNDSYTSYLGNKTNDNSQISQEINRDNYNNEEPEKEKKDDNEKKESHMNYPIWFICGLLAIVIIIAFIYEIRLYFIRKNIKQDNNSDNENKAIMSLFLYLMNSYFIIDKTNRFKNLEEYEEFIKDYESKCEAGYLEMMTLYQKARYSNKNCTKEQVNQMKCYCENVRKEIFLKLSKWQKFKWKFVYEYGSLK